jgi:RNA polymerase sigma-70 factor (ECF subfamily)
MPTPTSDTPDPDELLRRARAGSPADLGRLLEQYGNYLALLARVQLGRRLRGKAEADDLVQETFLKAHRDFPRFRGQTEAEFVGWLRRLLATSCAALVRRYLGTQARDVRLERELAGDLEQSSRALDGGLIAPQSTPSQQAARREQAVVLADALRRLPDHYAEVIILHHLEGLSLAQVARRLGRTEDSVEKLWTRALLRLRGALGGST